MNKEEKKEIIQRFGYNTISYQSLLEGLESYSDDEIEGFIAYKQIGKRDFIIVGDPLCKDSDIIALIYSFRKKHLPIKARILTISLSEKSKKYFDMMGFGIVPIGQEAIFELENFSLEGKQKADIRNMLKRATKEGVSIRHIKFLNKEEIHEIEKLNQDWLKTRKTQGFSFLLKLSALENIEDKYLCVAEKDGNIIGYISAVPIYARQGWYFEDIIRSETAPLGTNQLLVISMLELLKESGYIVASLGTAPLGNMEDYEDIAYKKTQKLLKLVYEHANGFYNFKGLYHFKKSLVPTTWESKYMAFYPPVLKPKLFLSLIKAYNPGGVKSIIFSSVLKRIPERMRKKH